MGMDEGITIAEIKEFSKGLKNHKVAVEKIDKLINSCVDEFEKTENMKMLSLSKELFEIKEILEGKC